jgi:hypothetical protein
MSDCRHEDFAASVAVNRMEDSGHVIADIRIACRQCGEPFRFLGCRVAGLSFQEPSVSVTELELHAPIEPQGDPRLRSQMKFEMPAVPVKN